MTETRVSTYPYGDSSFQVAAPYRATAEIVAEARHHTATVYEPADVPAWFLRSRTPRPSRNPARRRRDHVHFTSTRDDRGRNY